MQPASPEATSSARSRRTLAGNPATAATVHGDRRCDRPERDARRSRRARPRRRQPLGDRTERRRGKRLLRAPRGRRHLDADRPRHDSPMGRGFRHEERRRRRLRPASPGAGWRRTGARNTLARRNHDRQHGADAGLGDPGRRLGRLAGDEHRARRKRARLSSPGRHSRRRRSRRPDLRLQRHFLYELARRRRARADRGSRRRRRQQRCLLRPLHRQGQGARAAHPTSGQAEDQEPVQRSRARLPRLDLPLRPCPGARHAAEPDRQAASHDESELLGRPALAALRAPERLAPAGALHDSRHRDRSGRAQARQARLRDDRRQEGDRAEAPREGSRPAGSRVPGCTGLRPRRRRRLRSAGVPRHLPPTRASPSRRSRRRARRAGRSRRRAATSATRSRATPSPWCSSSSCSAR